VRRGATQSAANDIVGGATLTFDVHPDHPYYREVLGLLGRVRAEVNELWDAVQAHNETTPCPEDSKEAVSFYFGQCVTRPDDDPP
jgi:hypothetical protein